MPRQGGFTPPHGSPARECGEEEESPKGGSPEPRASSRGAGFTLVELLVVASLMVLVGGASVAVLAGGIRVWRRASELGAGRHTTVVAQEHLRRRLQNIRTFSPIPLRGAYDRLSYASAATHAAEEVVIGELGRRDIFFDARQRVLCEAFVPYRLMRRSQRADGCQVLLEDVTRVRFSYYGQQRADERPTWQSRWEIATSPQAVKMELTTKPPDHAEQLSTCVIALSGAGTVGPLASDDTE